MKHWLLTLVALALTLTLTRPAVASARLAVFIVADDEPLSNNLTEVAISRLAEKPGYELLGLRELEGRLNELSTVKSDGLRACLALPACISEVGTMAGVESALIGDVRREDDHYRLELALFDGTSGTPAARLSRQTPIDLDQLISAVQAGVFELVPDAEVERTPQPPVARAQDPSPSRHRALRETHEAPEREKESRAKSFVPYIAYGTAALAVVAFSTAAVTGTLATAHPVGDGRSEIQNDLERRKAYASVANSLFVAGGLLAGASAVTFVLSWE
jgi:hypothetical protein